VGAFPDHKPVKFGRYLLLDRINVGGMAEVFRGKMQGVQGFERMVALKRILPNIAADPDFIEMFVDEAKLAVQLQHANIAQIFDLGTVEEAYYIAMEYVSGTDLRSMWDRARQRNRLLPIAMSCHVIQKACEGLDAAHRKKDENGEDLGLVHRDVSPQNVLISFEGEVKVIDFGIAKAANKVSKTQAGVLKGKFGYMSPEQVRGVDLDNRSDIFAIGIVLYELLVGDRLFLGESDFSTLEKVRNVEMVPPTRLNKNLSPHLERIVMKALAKTREDRYRYASEMAEDLQRYLFSTNQPFSRTDMQRYMAQHFKEEIQKEKDRLDRYREVTFDQFAEEETRSSSGPHRELKTEANVSFQTPLARPEPAPQYREPTQSMNYPAPPQREVVHAPPPPHYYQQMQMPPPKPRMPAWAAGVIGALIVVLLGVVSLLFMKMNGKPAMGALAVDVKPADAEILVNDRKVANQSPFTIELDGGNYVVTVRAPGYKEMIRPVRIEAGAQVEEAFVLEQEKGKGLLDVTSDIPGLSVFIDGGSTGQVTPAKIDGLHSGAHEVMLKRPDGSIVHRTRVNLDENQPGILNVDTKKLRTILDVTSTPVGANVIVDGKPVGTTPLTIPGLRPGDTATVRLEKAGCEPFETKVAMAKATVSLVEATLVCGQAATASQGTGRINITATTVAEVFIDGRSFGKTPRFNMEIPAGTRVLKLVPEAGLPFETEVVIGAGEEKKIHHEFKN
jgi:serine/threonine protein kinase